MTPPVSRDQVADRPIAEALGDQRCDFPLACGQRDASRGSRRGVRPGSVATCAESWSEQRTMIYLGDGERHEVATHAAAANKLPRRIRRAVQPTISSTLGGGHHRGNLVIERHASSRCSTTSFPVHSNSRLLAGDWW
jgi:hypothetical protein